MSDVPERITPESVSRVKQSVVSKQKEGVEKPYKCRKTGCDQMFKTRAGRASHERVCVGKPVESVKEKVVEKSVEKSAAQVEVLAVGRIERAKQRLAQQEQVRFFIPLNMGEKPGATVEACINGYKMSYPKGKHFTAPKQVVDNFIHQMEVQNNAGAAYKTDRSDEVRDALTK